MNKIHFNRFLRCFWTMVGLIIISTITFAQLEWPEIKQENKPWTRWWWMGNILPENEVSAAMEAYKNAGLGGLEITPIYGVKGYEDRFVNFLSPEYVEKLMFVLKEGEKTGLGIDMATGTGWPFGGPWVTQDDACNYLAHKTYSLKTGENLKEPVFFIQKTIVRSVNGNVSIDELKEPISANKDLQSLALDQVRFPVPLPLQELMAYSDNGSILNLTDKVDSAGMLNWTAPAGNWTLYALFLGWHGKMVERAGPGGEGNVIDHFSKQALTDYLKKFDDALAGKDISSLRAFFNDSYEVDDANGEADWTPDFLNEFSNRRGYDLLNRLPALFGDDTTGENHSRVLCDFRRTISELLLEKFTTAWSEWAHSKGAIIRNQAHGSPANILDLYAAIDIPECEGQDILRCKFASSAAHVTGKQLTSSESATWLNEHFLSTLGDVKFALDRLMLGGVNHIFYHGTTFSPQTEPWPGWMFYASVHFGLTNTWWKDFSKLNNYVAHCQSFLQDGKPDNDILLYFNFFDKISEPGRSMLQHFPGGGFGTTTRTVGETLLRKGYAFDLISDNQFDVVKFQDDELHCGGTNYQVVVVPECKYMPLETFKKLFELATSGATIIVQNQLPADVPGFSNLEIRRKKFNELKSHLRFENIDDPYVQKAELGSGCFLIGADLDKLLAFAKIRRETMIDQGLQSVRRSYDGGSYYFITNWGEKAVDGWIPLTIKARSIALFDPMTEKSGMGAVKLSKNGNTQVYLQLEQGGSCILKSFDNPVNAEAYNYIRKEDQPIAITGTWHVSFTEGGPELPKEVHTDSLKSWTEFGGEEVKRFSGTANYEISFKKPKLKCDGWYLDFGRVAESARVKLNGKDLGTLIYGPFRIYIASDQLLKINTLEIDVTNLMANRIAYMDQEGILYKKFYNINFPSKLRENRGADGLFTAANWPPRESGLIGPVTLVPVNKLKIQ